MKWLIKILSAVIAASISFSLSSCAGIYDKEIVSINDYVPTEQVKTESIGDRITVSDISELRNAFISFVDAGAEEGSIVFSESYSGDASDDIASAVWYARTKDALCAYCVENISYEINKILSSTEARIHVTYSDNGVPLNDIIKLEYAAGLETILQKAIEDGARKTAFLVNKSSFTDSAIEKMVSDLYKENPIISPIEPTASVVVFSGMNSRKLYEVSLSFKMFDDQRAERMSSLRVFSPFTQEHMLLDEHSKAELIFSYLQNNCLFNGESGGTIYDALISGKSGSEGIALAFVALSKMLDMNSLIVYGQYTGTDTCWNLINIDGNWYHTDTARFLVDHENEQNKEELLEPDMSGEDKKTEETETPIESEESVENSSPLFFCNDIEMWNNYRWDVSAYPASQ